MKLKKLRFKEGFRVINANRRSQAAEMVIPPGEAEGDPSVVAGTATALVKGRRHKLGPGSLVFIAHGERHEIRNTGRTLLRTLNFYVPPAYSKRGEPLPRGRR